MTGCVNPMSFTQSVTPPSVSKDAASVMRQAIAGMLWSKQFFFFDGDNWLDEHQSNPLHSGYRNARNSEWYHMLNQDIISMPDKWEFPGMRPGIWPSIRSRSRSVDPDFAKDQMTSVHFATGMIPCPLTTFVLSYALARGVLASGLLVTAAMAVGMITTIGGVALVAAFARDRLVGLLARSEGWRHRAGMVLEVGGAALVLLLGVSILLASMRA